MRHFRVLATVIIFAAAAHSALAKDLAALSEDEVLSLQHRLRDAGCFKEAVDGKVTPALTDAIKICPSQDPILLFESHVHTAVVFRIGVDRQCKTLVTGSEDKTVRTWSLPTGEPLDTYRLPVGEGNAGKIYAVAISPDGKRIAAGGWDAYYKRAENGVYLFNNPTDGRLFRANLLTDRAIHHLAFTSDGSKLAVALDGKAGVRIIDANTGSILMSDRDYAERSRGLAFGPDDTLYAVAYDGYLRHYSSDYSRTHKVKTPGGNRPHSVAVDPSGTRLAVGYDDARTVEIFDAKTLERIAVTDNTGIGRGNLLAVAWSSDGKYLLGGGRYQRQIGGEAQYPVRIWDAQGRQINEVIAADNTVLSMVPCGDSVYYAAHGPVYGRIDTAAGKVAQLGVPSIPDMRGKRDRGFVVSPDGMRLRFGLAKFAKDPVLFDLSAPSLRDAPDAPDDLQNPDTAGLKVENWLNHLKPRLDGKPITLARLEESRSLAIRPDRSGFVLGAEWSLRSFDAAGKQRWSREVPGAVWGVNLARDGELIIAAFGDGTVRWFRWSDGQELLALFVDKKDKRWVAWTPGAYYATSPGAERMTMLGWHVNSGWNQMAHFLPVSRLRERTNRPDVLRLVLQTLDEDEAVKRADAIGK